MKKVYLSIFSILCASSVFAQDASINEIDAVSPIVVETTDEETEDVDPLQFSGYVDSYYFYNTNGVDSNLGASGFERIFDQKSNSFQVGLAQLVTTYSTNKVTGVIDLVFGNHADLGDYGNGVSPLGFIGGTGLAIKQAYITWNVNDKIDITAGQFGTNVGYEVIDAPVNFNYSLSNLFGNGPFYHTGVKLDYAVNDKFGLMVGLNNGLDSKDDNNKSKGVMAQVYIAPVDGWDVYLNYFGTDESADGMESDYYQWFDITTAYALPGGLNLGLNAATGSNNIGSWSGAAFYANKNLSDVFALGARYEYFNNNEGGIYLTNSDGIGASVNSFTLTGNFDLSPNLKLKPEYRFDKYKAASGETNWLLDTDGELTKDSQSTIGAAMIFYF